MRFAQGREAELFATLGRHDQDRRAAVGDLGGVAGGDRAVLLEGTAQLDSELGGRLARTPSSIEIMIGSPLRWGTATRRSPSANLPAAIAAAAS